MMGYWKHLLKVPNKKVVSVLILWIGTFIIWKCYQDLIYNNLFKVFYVNNSRLTQENFIRKTFWNQMGEAHSNLTMYSQDENDVNVKYEPGRCSVQKSIYYLKVHKTGSTTFSNMLMRFGMQENCTFACFSHYHAYPATNMVQYLLPHPKDLGKRSHLKHKFDIVSVHTVYNHTAIQRFMSNGTKFVATLRHPLSQMISAFYHYKLPERLNMTSFTDPVREFLSKPQFYDRPLPGSMYNIIAKKTGIKLSFTKNRMAFEFGFNLHNVNNDSYVTKHLQHLNKVFDTVLITEHYEESLLLLKRKFCWTYKDILYLQLRKQSYKEKGINYKEEFGNLYENHKQWAELDYTLYNHFLRRHKLRVLNGGKDFSREVQHFRSLLKIVSAFCFPLYNKTVISLDHKQFKYSNEYITIQKSQYHPEFVISSKDCLAMTLNEIFFNNIIFSKQYSKYCKTKRKTRFWNFYYKNRCVKRNLNNPQNLYGFPLKYLNKQHLLL